VGILRPEGSRWHHTSHPSVTQLTMVVTLHSPNIPIIFTDMHTCRHFAKVCEARPCGCYTAEWRVSHAGTTQMLVGLILETGALKRHWPYEHGRADARGLFQCPPKDVGDFLQEANGPMSRYVGSVVLSKPVHRRHGTCCFPWRSSRLHTWSSQRIAKAGATKRGVLRGEIGVCLLRLFRAPDVPSSDAERVLIRFPCVFGVCSVG
jgi:hypothetical protein